MKRILLFLTILSSTLLINARHVYDAAIKFSEGEKKHKRECFELEKRFSVDKLNLLEKQHEEKYNLNIECLKKLEREGFSEALLEEGLARKVALCEKHLTQWKTLCDEHHRIGEEAYRLSKEMLEDFKRSHTDLTTRYRSYETKPEAEKTGFLGTLEKMLEGLGASSV